jgi:hypothetical protein
MLLLARSCCRRRRHHRYIYIFQYFHLLFLFWRIIFYQTTTEMELKMNKKTSRADESLRTHISNIDNLRTVT